ncbi:MAG TPA: hypothetical protein VHP33_26555 [Polyangiaceae bacterium]|nr:hypothetical protein [Polyangiaceae bacterium]
MHLRSTLVGSASLLALLGVDAPAEACGFQAPTVGWSPDARLPCRLAEADLLANTAREPAPLLPSELTNRNRQAYDKNFWPWFLRVTDAAARAGAWYLTDAIGAAPFDEQAQQRWQTEYEPLPELGPSTAAYVLLGETSWTDSDQLAAALAGPRVGISPEQYIDALESVGSLFDDIANVAPNGGDGDSPDYAGWVSETTSPITKVLFYRCRMASTQMQVWTKASRRCEVWLGEHWKSQIELASLDELLPVADQVPVPPGWAPVAR